MVTQCAIRPASESRVPILNQTLVPFQLPDLLHPPQQRVRTFVAARYGAARFSSPTDTAVVNITPRARDTAAHVTSVALRNGNALSTAAASLL